MMKYTFVVMFSLLSLVSIGQQKLLDILPLKDGLITFSEVVQVDSASKDVLYSRAKKWFINTYKSAKDVIQLDDKESGELTGKGVFKIGYYTKEPSINHLITLSVKDGRYRYVITNLVYSDIENKQFAIEEFPKAWTGKKKLYNSINDRCNLIITS